MNLQTILLIILILALFGGGGFGFYSGWNHAYSGGISIVGLLVLLLLLRLLGII